MPTDTDKDLFLLLALEDDEDELALLLLLESEEEHSAWKHAHFELDLLPQDFCRTAFRFERTEIRRLARALRVPDPIVLPNRVQVSAVFGLCLLLRRFAYPCRLSDLLPTFGTTATTLGKVITFMVDHICQNFSHLLSNLQQPWLHPDRLEVFAQKVSMKGAPLDNSWGFIDGTVRPICRPKHNQRDMFSGHKRTHAMKFQAIMAPNGLLATLNGPFAGKRHDSGILNESGLLPLLEERMNTSGGNPLCIYGDAAYPLRPHLMCPYKGASLTRDQENFNKAMATVRDCVEWGFGKIISLFAFLDYKKNLKMYRQPVGNFYIVGALLTNAHTCLYSSQTSIYFDMQPPSLEEYLCPGLVVQ